MGHTEGASGIISLIKVITMMHQGFIPPQASHTKMNHNIDVRPDDMMELVTELRSWDDEHKVALINNYGACGSNASMIVAQPHGSSKAVSRTANNNNNSQYPFWIPGLDTRAITAYCTKLAQYLSSLPKSSSPNLLADLSFNLSRQSNRNLAQGYIFTSRSISELEEKLLRLEGRDQGPVKAEKPVILCFGGQVSRHIGLDRQLYDSVAVFRQHLDDVDSVATSLGVPSIFPDIFSRQPVQDTVQLQTMLFAMQYACANSWEGSGLQGKIAAVVGHSFGEITALCVSGALNLQDTVRLVVARAKLVRDAWGPEPGAMMAVEADESIVHKLVREANSAPGSGGSLSIACYNGPRSFTLAGTTAALDAVQPILHDKYAQIKSKRLSVTNAFHSKLVEPLLHDLEQIGKQLDFHPPVIPIERATDDASSSNDKLDWTFVARHMRQPVFFNDAVQRLSKKHPQAIFLEAGSNSTITVMAARALASSTTQQKDQHFQGLSVTNCESSLDGLTNTIVSLWKQGLRVNFWAHHPVQTSEYQTLVLPPYQFDKSSSSRHWLPIQSAGDVVNQRVSKALAKTGSYLPEVVETNQQKPLRIWDFVGYQDSSKKHSRFRINPESDRYMELVSAHVVAHTAPICPATLEFDIMIEAVLSLLPQGTHSNDMKPAVRDMVNHSPICFDPSRVIYLDLVRAGTEEWNTRFFSVENDSGRQETHVEASVQVRSSTDGHYIKEFSQLSRMVSHSQTKQLLHAGLDEPGVEILQGRQVYRAFSQVVDYSEIYRGVRYVVGRDNECAGLVQLDRKHRRTDTLLDVPLSDSFAQIGGMWTNLMSPDTGNNNSNNDIYIAKGVELLMRAPGHQAATHAAIDAWHVYARHARDGERSYITDVFVFDPTAGELVEVMLGVQWGRVAKASMSRMLQMRTKDESVLRIKPGANVTNVVHSQQPRNIKAGSTAITSNPASTASPTPAADHSFRKPIRPDMTDKVRGMVASLTGIEASELELDVEIMNYGIDSLMGLEIGREGKLAYQTLRFEKD